MSADYSHKNNAVQAAINSSYQRSNLGSGYQLSAGMTYQVPKTWKFDPSKKIDAKVCYVIATWSGRRRAGNNIFHENPIFYLEKHFDRLQQLKHSINLIVLAIPDNQEEPENFTKFIGNLPPIINGANLVILRRENLGQSYGSYSDAFNLYPTFDYYIFIEDDYVPNINDFDHILIQMLNTSPECGYLCSYAHNRPPEGPHAAISNGITSRPILEKVKAQLKNIPFGGQSTKTRAYGAEPQLDFSRGFLKIHTKIYDYLSHYNSPFNEAGTFMMYGDPKLPTLFYPAQFLAKS